MLNLLPRCGFGRILVLRDMQPDLWLQSLDRFRVLMCRRCSSFPSQSMIHTHGAIKTKSYWLIEQAVWEISIFSGLITFALIYILAHRCLMHFRVCWVPNARFWLQLDIKIWKKCEEKHQHFVFFTVKMIIRFARCSNPTQLTNGPSGPKIVFEVQKYCDEGPKKFHFSFDD